MPQDIFISYSRKDSVHALSIAERSRADRKGIVGVVERKRNNNPKFPFDRHEFYEEIYHFQ
jgi:hypothetical protein